MTQDKAGLARSARSLRWVAWTGMALVAAALVFGTWALLTDSNLTGALTVSVDRGGQEAIPALAVLVIAGGLLLLALGQIVGITRLVEQGAPLRTGPGLRRFALYLFLSLLAASLLPPLIQAVQSLAGAAQRVHLSLSSEELVMLFVTGLLFFVARLLEAAQRVDDEMRQIV